MTKEEEQREEMGEEGDGASRVTLPWAAQEKPKLDEFHIAINKGTRRSSETKVLGRSSDPEGLPPSQAIGPNNWFPIRVEPP